MKARTLIGIYICIVFLLPSPVISLPISDGKISENEWTDAYQKDVELTNGQYVDLRYQFDEERIYFLAIVPHNAPGDEIILDPNVPHDYFGIEFDNNGDQTIMGTLNSPDDTILINYEENNASDMYMHNFKAYYDRENNGENNVVGAVGTDNESLIFEFERPLVTGDSLGHDIVLKKGDKVGFMLAFWDDKPPHSAAVFVSTRVGNDQFQTLTIGEPESTIVLEVVTMLILVLSLGIGWYVSQRSGFKIK